MQTGHHFNLLNNVRWFYIFFCATVSIQITKNQDEACAANTQSTLRHLPWWWLLNERGRFLNESTSANYCSYCCAMENSCVTNTKIVNIHSCEIVTFFSSCDSTMWKKIRDHVHCFWIIFTFSLLHECCQFTTTPTDHTPNWWWWKLFK